MRFRAWLQGDLPVWASGIRLPIDLDEAATIHALAHACESVMDLAFTVAAAGYMDAAANGPSQSDPAETAQSYVDAAIGGRMKARARQTLKLAELESIG